MAKVFVELQTTGASEQSTQRFEVTVPGIKPLPKFIIFEDDEIPVLVMTWLKQNLTGFTLIDLIVQRPSPAALLTVNHTVVDLVNGRVSFAFAAGDLVEGPSQRANIRVTNAGGAPLVIAEFDIDVLPRRK